MTLVFRQTEVNIAWVAPGGDAVYEVPKFLIAFVMGVLLSIVSYKYFGVPGFLGAPGEWTRAPYIAVSLDQPFAPVAADPYQYGPPMCATVVRIENHTRHRVNLAYLLQSKAGDSSRHQDRYPPDEYGDNPRSDDDESPDGYGQDNSGQGDTPTTADIKPDEAVHQTVKIAVGGEDSGRDGDDYDSGHRSGSACDALNRRGAVTWQLAGCSRDGVSNPADADCSREVRAGF